MSAAKKLDEQGGNLLIAGRSAHFNLMRKSHPRWKPFLSGIFVKNNDLRGVDLRNSIIERGVFKNCELHFGQFVDGIFFGTHFENCRLYGANFESADLQSAAFYSSDLAFVIFDKADLFDVQGLEDALRLHWCFLPSGRNVPESALEKFRELMRDCV